MQPMVVKDTIPERIGVYQVGEEIGRGSVAVVYRAVDRLYDREVALKVLHPYFAHYLSFVRHFIAEGREGMRLRHPNIVQVFDAGQSDGIAFIAQELLLGGTLADMVQARGGPFTLDETVAVIEQVAAGLDYAHQLGCLHRNLKPSNLFFADHGRVQIADFTAPLTAGSALPPNYPVGTPSFMAPEQARGDSGLDQRADVYSLGAIAYLMLSGRVPFEADNPLVLLRKIIEEPPPLLERLQPQIDPAVAQALSQVLAKRPSARYLTASAFAQSLAHGQPIAPREPAVESPVAEVEAPAVHPPLIPHRPSPKRSTGMMTVPRRAVMIAGMAMVTLLLLLLIIAVQVVPGFFERVTNRETPSVPQIAVLDPIPLTPTNTAAAQPPTVVATTALELAGVDTVPAADVAVNPTSVVTPLATRPSNPPPTVRVLPTTVAVAIATRPPTPTAMPVFAVVETTPTDTPTESPLSASPTATITLAAAIGNITLANELPLPAGRIAYTVRNLRTGQLDTAIYNVATGVSWPILPAKRQPDFNNQSDLVLNSEGGGVDALVLMRHSGELLGIASAFDEDSHPHWAPNNKSIIFASSLVGDGRYRLYLQRDDNYGQKVSPLMYDAWELFGRYPIFLLDGRVVYNGCNVWENASTCGLFVVDVWGGRPENLTTWPGDIPTDNLGNQVLLMSERDSDWNIYLLNANTGDIAQLTDDPGVDGLATASPDGNYVAFISDRSGVWSLYIMRADGSEQRKLFDLPGGYGTGAQDWLEQRLSWGR